MEGGSVVAVGVEDVHGDHSGFLEVRAVIKEKVQVGYND